MNEVIMYRDFFGSEVRQKSKSEFLSATDLAKIGNIYRVSNGLSLFNMAKYLETQGTKEFANEIEKETGTKAVIKADKKGRNGCTWVHPFLFLDMAMTINPTFKLKACNWLYDFLLRYRNDSGESYKKMCGAIYIAHGDKVTVHKEIIKTANTIKKALGVDDWQRATETQLKQRDTIHNNISLLLNVIKKDIEQVVDIAITETLKDYENS